MAHERTQQPVHQLHHVRITMNFEQALLLRLFSAGIKVDEIEISNLTTQDLYELSQRIENEKLTFEWVATEN